MTRLLVVAPQPAVRAGLRALLGLAEDLEVVGEAELLGQVTQPLLEAHPDVLVVDSLALPGDERGEPLPDDIPAWPSVVVLGASAAEPRLPPLPGAPAWAYLSHQAGAEQLIAAVRAVAQGLIVLEPAVGASATPGASFVTEVGLDPADDLTLREREVLQLVALGLANKGIAARLNISEHTVKFHVASILSKLGAGSRTEAVHLGARRGLVVL